MPREARSDVWRALREQQLLPRDREYHACTLAAFALGDREVRRYDWCALGWQHANLLLPRPYEEPDLARMFGFGGLLTRFFVEPLQPADRDEVVSLGALANFIVAAFDQFVDELGERGRAMLTRDLLQRLLRGDCVAEAGVIAALAAAYLERIRALGRDSPHITTLHRTIAAMYEAELATLGGPASPARLRRKSALPFVVMGLGAWLPASRDNAQTRRWHVRWLYELGDVLGWIDDVVDLEADETSGHPNRLRMAVAKPGWPQSLAYRARRLLDEWEARTPHAAGKPSGRDIFGTTLISWFGAAAPSEESCS